jgi:hypothetical protein
MSLTPLTAKRPNEVDYYGQPPYDVGASSPYKLPLVGAFGAAGIVSTTQDLLRFVVTTSGQVPGSTPWYDADMGNSAMPYPAPPAPPGAVLEWNIDGSLPGTTTSYGEYNSVTYVFLGNSRNPKLNTDDTPFFNAAKTTNASPPSGNLAPGLIPGAGNAQTSTSTSTSSQATPSRRADRA